jgi:diguanylate cyclase (GGDEF)-like protein
MKISIINFLNQLKIHLTLVSILSIAILLSNATQNQSAFILKSLYSHQEMAEKLNIMYMDKQSELGMIEVERISTEMQFSSSDIKKALYFDPVGHFLQDVHYQNEQIDVLQSRSLAYCDAVKSGLNSNESVQNKNLENFKNPLDNLILELMKFHTHILFQKDALMSYLLFFTTFYIILLTIIYYSKIAKTVRDFEAISILKSDYEYQTKELDQLHRSAYKTLKSKQAEIYLDPLTKLNNVKGLLNKYSNKQIPSNYSYCLYIFSIDDYKAISDKISKANSQSILKKIAFISSLYEKNNDYAARIGFDEFVLILPRADKEEAFEACEQLRKTIEETTFNFTGIDLNHLSVSGAFIIKPKDKSLDETIKYGIHFLKTSKKREINKTFKILGF